MIEGLYQFSVVLEIGGNHFGPTSTKQIFDDVQRAIDSGGEADGLQLGKLMRRRFEVLYKIAHFQELPRGEADEVLETAVEMALIDETGLLSRLRNGNARTQELLGALDAQVSEILVRRHAQRFTKSA